MAIKINRQKRRRILLQAVHLRKSHKSAETCRPGRRIWESAAKFLSLKGNIQILKMLCNREDGYKILIKNQIITI